jgi:hypothetical protein
MAAPILKFKRGALTELPSLAIGEPGFTTDKYDLYLGSSAGNKFVGSGRFWSTETATAGSGVRFFEATDNGAHSTLIQSAASMAANVTYKLPIGQGNANTVLTNDGSGNLSWGAGSANSVLTGVTTVQGSLDVEADSEFSGLTTFTNTTNNTLGNVNSGAVQLDGGMGIAKNLTVGAAASITSDFFVSGISTFVGAVTFQGGTINLGDADTDDINVGGEFISSLVPNADKSVDLGEFDKQWRDVYAGGSVYGYESLVSTEAANTTVTYAVTVASKTANHRYNGSGSSSGYFIDGSESPILTLVPGVTYRFTHDNTGSHPLKFYLEADKTTLYETGVSFQNTYTEITVGDETPAVLHYQCTAHSLMGNAVVTQSNVVNSNYAAILRGGLNVSGAESVLSSATVSDLTSGRVVLAGTGGVLEDSALLTHTGGTGLVVTGNANVTGIATFNQLEVGSASATLVGITSIVDEDNMGSNSATALATQQSIKAYVDNQVTAQDLDLAGDSGTGAVDLDSQSLTIAGTLNEIETVASNQTVTIGLPSTVNVTTKIDVPTIEVTDIKARDGTSALTLTNSTGAVSCAEDLTVTGNFTVLGSQSIVNTETLKVEDSLIEVGLVNSSGNLVAPSSDANIDVGILFHYYSGSAKKAAVYWDDSVGRIVFGSDVSETNSVLSATANTGYSGIEIRELYVNDCAGVSQVISCTGTTRNLENITVDGGTFT